MKWETDNKLEYGDIVICRLEGRRYNNTGFLMCVYYGDFYDILVEEDTQESRVNYIVTDKVIDYLKTGENVLRGENS